MLPSFKDWLSVDEAWVQKSIRRRLQGLKKGIATGEHPSIKRRSGEPLDIDYTSMKDARGDFQAAAARAQQMNRETPGGVSVYYSIVPNNVKRPLADILKFFIEPPDPDNEQSISVKKGIWESGLVLAGKTKRLLAYWDTDVRTKGVKTSHDPEKVPTQAHRSSDFRPYDEGLVRLGDVKWHTMHYDPNNKFIMDAIGGQDKLQAIADQFGLALKPLGVKPEEGGSDDPIVTSRHSTEQDINLLVRRNTEIYKLVKQKVALIVRNGTRVSSQRLVTYAQQTLEEINKLDPAQSGLRDHAQNRVMALKKTYSWLNGVLRQLKTLGADNRDSWYDDEQSPAPSHVWDNG